VSIASRACFSFERPPISDLAATAPDQIQSVRRYVANVQANLDTGRGLWIQGDVGTGKTTLAMLVSKAALDAGRSVAIYSLPRLLNLLRESMDSDGGMLDFMDRLTAVDLLDAQTSATSSADYRVINGGVATIFNGAGCCSSQPSNDSATAHSLPSACGAGFWIWRAWSADSVATLRPTAVGGHARGASPP